MNKEYYYDKNENEIDMEGTLLTVLAKKLWSNKMSLFNIFKEAGKNDHEARLEREMQETMQLLYILDEKVLVRVLIGFIDKREKLLSKIQNMRSKKRIKMGQLLQNEAREKHNVDLAESCVLWMTGAWMESMNHKTRAACEVYASLNDLAGVPINAPYSIYSTEEDNY